jgi:hypothetical protein
VADHQTLGSETGIAREHILQQESGQQALLLEALPSFVSSP